MAKCLICLGKWATKKYCCVITHKRCQKRWGSSCIICKKNTGIFSRNSYVFVQPEPEFTQEEIDEQYEIERRMQQLRDIHNELNLRFPDSD